MATNRQPLGIELVKRGIVKQEDITKALDLQRNKPNMKLGDILYEMNVTDPNKLLSTIGDILNEKTIMLTPDNISIKIEESWLSADVLLWQTLVPVLPIARHPDHLPVPMQQQSPR